MHNLFYLKYRGNTTKLQLCLTFNSHQWNVMVPSHAAPGNAEWFIQKTIFAFAFIGGQETGKKYTWSREQYKFTESMVKWKSCLNICTTVYAFYLACMKFSRLKFSAIRTSWIYGLAFNIHILFTPIMSILMYSIWRRDIY